MPNQNSNVPPGWIGGFAESNPAFAYPDPNLSSLPMLDNMANINRIKRQQRVYWPEFSWETIKGDPSSRCFQRFAHDISSIGYDNTGRIWSIICPQQGACAPNIACLNVEVTVTGQRGWVNETNRELAADMTVEAKIWFSPSSHQNWIVRQAWDLFAKESLPFPSDKANAIQVHTHNVGNPDQPIFPVLIGQSPLFEAPIFAKHPKAWTVGHIEVEIGRIIPTNYPTVDTFNQKILDIFNIATGNMLLQGNVLTWNLWFIAPELVNTEQWRTHAERWRKAIDADHGPRSSKARYADGSVFTPQHDFLQEADDIIEIIESLL
ncbi:hypothetical protein [Okeania sp. SIO3B5]|uniref:hypothetical protein n=1 Tax=Okeania sp. SIO3B5 TaxID=2607811 RepID=UPI0025CDFCC3|nr:hypothetical protein [Okeania sp. SIO3B5]